MKKEIINDLAGIDPYEPITEEWEIDEATINFLERVIKFFTRKGN